MNGVSLVQCEAMTRCAIRKISRENTMRFMHKNPGLMMGLIDSIVSNSNDVFF
jgi:hypothetical protein